MSRRGHDRERAVRAWYADRDWLAFRAPASLGCADVVAMRAMWDNDPAPRNCVSVRFFGSNVELVEVKSTARGPYEHFGPEARAKLSAAARMAGAQAVLVWWPPRGKMHRIDESEWPEARKAA